MTIIGVNPNADEHDPSRSLGSRGTTNESKDYVYLRGGEEALVPGSVVAYDANFAAVPVSTANAVSGRRLAVATVAVEEDHYFWGQVTGAAQVLVAEDTAANARLNLTAAAGTLDDSATGATVNGIILTAAREAGTGAGLAAGDLNSPTIGEVASAARSSRKS